MINNDMIMRLYEQFLTIVNTVEQSDKLLKLIEDYSEQLLFCPASSRSNFHCAYTGGLLEHSLKVYDTFNLYEKIFIQLGGKPTWTEDEKKITTLFHDLGKAGEPGIPYYIKMTSKWHIDKGILYETNKELSHMEHEERSVYMLQQYGVKLSKNIWEGILYHQGPFNEFNKSHYSGFNSNVVPIFSILVHQADWMSSMIENQNGE